MDRVRTIYLFPALHSTGIHNPNPNPNDLSSLSPDTWLSLDLDWRVHQTAVILRLDCSLPVIWGATGRTLKMPLFIYFFPSPHSCRGGTTLRFYGPLSNISLTCHVIPIAGWNDDRVRFADGIRRNHIRSRHCETWERALFILLFVFSFFFFLIMGFARVNAYGSLIVLGFPKPMDDKYNWGSA